MKEAVRRKSRPWRAASEFFHAAFTCLVVHAFAGNVIAPCMRIMTVGFRNPGGLGEGMAMFGPDSAVDEWAALDAEGKGGWPSWGSAGAVLASNPGMCTCMA